MLELVVYLAQLQRVGPLLQPTFERGPRTAFWGFFAFGPASFCNYCKPDPEFFAFFTNLISWEFAKNANSGVPGISKIATDKQ